MLKQFFQRNPRLAGVLLLVIAIFLAKFEIIDVISAAQAHAENVSLSMKGVIFAIAFSITGLYLAIGGAFADNLLRAAPGSRRLSPIGWLAVVITVGVSFGSYALLKHYLESFGYKF